MRALGSLVVAMLGGGVSGCGVGVGGGNGDGEGGINEPLPRMSREDAEAWAERVRSETSARCEVPEPGGSVEF